MKFGKVTNNHRLFSKMEKYGIPKFWSQWHFKDDNINPYSNRGYTYKSIMHYIYILEQAS